MSTHLPSNFNHVLSAERAAEAQDYTAATAYAAIAQAQALARIADALEGAQKETVDTQDLKGMAFAKGWAAAHSH